MRTNDGTRRPSPSRSLPPSTSAGRPWSALARERDRVHRDIEARPPLRYFREQRLPELPGCARRAAGRGPRVSSCPRQWLRRTSALFVEIGDRQPARPACAMPLCGSRAIEFVGDADDQRVRAGERRGGYFYDMATSVSRRAPFSVCRAIISSSLVGHDPRARRAVGRDARAVGVVGDRVEAQAQPPAAWSTRRTGAACSPMPPVNRRVEPLPAAASEPSSRAMR